VARSRAGVHKTPRRVPGREDGRARIPEMSGADDRIEAKAILGIPPKPDPGVVDLRWGRRATASSSVRAKSCARIMPSPRR
jgi:hypothetical protein